MRPPSRMFLISSSPSSVSSILCRSDISALPSLYCRKLRLPCASDEAFFPNFITSATPSVSPMSIPMSIPAQKDERANVGDKFVGEILVAVATLAPFFFLSFGATLRNPILDSRAARVRLVVVAPTLAVAAPRPDAATPVATLRLDAATLVAALRPDVAALVAWRTASPRPARACARRAARPARPSAHSCAPECRAIAWQADSAACARSAAASTQQRGAPPGMARCRAYPTSALRTWSSRQSRRSGRRLVPGWTRARL
eukprot:103613-Prymnesium_polylepis.1